MVETVPSAPGILRMKLLLCFLVWCLLLALCWPLALLTLIRFPLVWLAARPFRLVGLVVHAGFNLLRAVRFLPARLLSFGRFR